MNRSRWSLCCAMLLLASCGGDSGEDAATTTNAQNSAPTTIADPTTLDSSPAAVAIDVSPCSLVTADEVAEATGLAVVDSTPQPPITCVFDLGVDSGVDVFVAVDDGQGRLSGPASLFADYSARISDGSAEAITDIGEAAVFDAGFRTIAIEAGDGRYFAVGVNGRFQALQDPRDALIELAAAAIDRL